MKKLAILLLAFFIFAFLISQPVSAEEDFTNNITVNYLVHQDGVTTVSYDVTLINNLSGYYAPSYTIVLSGTKPMNPRATDNGKPIALDKSEKDGVISLKVLFADAVVGKGNSRRFTISFEDNTLTTKTGEVWEVNIPKLSTPNAFNDYQVKLIVPPSLGELAYISPQYTQIENVNGNKAYVFDKRTVSKLPVTAAFGQFQVFEFDLTYHLENPLSKTAIAEIAIPPDTAYQKVNYKSLFPTPDTVTIDSDGNWLAVYKLKARERIDVKAIGAVQIFSGPRYSALLDPTVRSENLKPTEVWQTKSAVISDLAKNLKTPRAIYDYVVNTLDYDYQRVKPNVIRLGAETALLSPKSAICMEFTDTFVALARASGIPAREVNGYAYTENTQIQPLSLVSDVLHAWPEYWDQEKGVWVPVDPTWGKTTGGVDYFSKLDLRHFTFVIHGSDAYKPYPPGSYKLGPSPQKDVFVNFGKLPESRITTAKITVKTYQPIPVLTTKIVGNVTNPGPTSIANKTIEIYFDGKLVLSEKVTLLPPYASLGFEKNIPFSLLGKNTPSKIEVMYDGVVTTLPTQKSTVIIVSLAGILLAIFVFILLYFVKGLNNNKYEKLKKLFSRKKSA